MTDKMLDIFSMENFNSISIPVRFQICCQWSNFDKSALVQLMAWRQAPSRWKPHSEPMRAKQGLDELTSNFTASELREILW